MNSTFEEADLDRNGLIDMNEYQVRASFVPACCVHGVVITHSPRFAQLLDAKHPGLSDFLTVDALGVLNHLERVHSMSVGGSGAPSAE